MDASNTDSKIETASIAPVASEPKAEPAAEIKVDAAPFVETRSAEATHIEAPAVEVPAKLDAAINASPGWRDAITAKASALRASPMALLAASVVFAAGIGAVLGAVGAANVGVKPKPEVEAQRVLPGADVRALTAAVGQLKTDIAALKATTDTVARSSTVQFARINERVERIDKGQADPAAKLAKIAEAVERLDQRVAAVTTNINKDVTGSVAPRPGMPAPQPAAAAQPDPQKAVLEGWRVRSVYNGAALLQGRGGLIEVEPGDTLPGGGRIERISRQDGRWVVVTSRGMILSIR